MLYVHTQTHTCTLTPTHSSGWCASCPASFHTCKNESVWFYHSWSGFKIEMPQHFAFSSFFSIADFAWNIYCAFLWRDLSGGKRVFLWACLLFEYIPFLLSHSLLQHGLSTALIDPPLTQLSPPPAGLQTWSSSQVVLFVLEDSLVFLCPPRVAFCSLLQFCLIGFLSHGQCPKALWSEWTSGTVLASEFERTSGCRPFCFPSPGQYCSCSFVLPWKELLKLLLEKKMRVANPVPSEYCEIILKNHPVDPVSLETYVSSRLCPNMLRFIGTPLWNAK